MKLECVFHVLLHGPNGEDIGCNQVQAKEMSQKWEIHNKSKFVCSIFQEMPLAMCKSKNVLESVQK
jgi:hypothetical protein